jgi:YD repeat-containing protein
VAGCGAGSEPPSDPDAPVADPYRLVSVGTLSTITYEGAHAATIAANYSDYTLTWNGDELAQVTAMFRGFSIDHTIQANLTYVDQRLARVGTTCTGACGFSSREDLLTYNDDGSLATWTYLGETTTYGYDDEGRLTSIDRADVHDIVEYADGPCPVHATERGDPHDYTYADGRLTATGSGTQYAVLYNAEGWIRRFEGTGFGFDDLLYEPGEMADLDLWPGHFNGGFVYGFPARGELFRLDGSCDPTMRSQPTIRTIVISTLLYPLPPT